MQESENRQALADEIRKTAGLLLGESDGEAESDRDLWLEGVDRAPREILAYQLGWMELLRGWDHDELAGKTPELPAPGCKWNQMGGLYQSFYDRYEGEPLAGFRERFSAVMEELTGWLEGFGEKELFEPGGRKWAQSTPLELAGPEVDAYQYGGTLQIVLQKAKTARRAGGINRTGRTPQGRGGEVF